jgi:hypothetical protein
VLHQQTGEWLWRAADGDAIPRSARGVRRVLEAALPDGRTSPNQIAVVDMVVAFFAAVLTGGAVR